MSELPPRVRVTAPREPQHPRAFSRGSRGREDPGGSIAETRDVFVQGLVRAQLRLAFGCAIGCCLTIAVLTVLVATVPFLHSASLFGVPWAWLLQAYGMYPVVALFGFAYIRAAARNEQRYRSLRERE
ncbi:hypothetical protein [Propionicicella superfundia]|uniref:hypothetical protein n=1 Tax=Propionicicella superfundia TaxID=348582 RepID=UPI00048FA5AB|nr:hypothetical protein [Propionicicella superfundia]